MKIEIHFYLSCISDSFNPACCSGIDVSISPKYVWFHSQCVSRSGGCTGVLPDWSAAQQTASVHPHAPAVASGSVALDWTVAAVGTALRYVALLIEARGRGHRQQCRSFPLTRPRSHCVQAARRVWRKTDITANTASKGHRGSVMHRSHTGFYWKMAKDESLIGFCKARLISCQMRHGMAMVEGVSPSPILWTCFQVMWLFVKPTTLFNQPIQKFCVA